MLSGAEQSQDKNVTFSSSPSHGVAEQAVAYRCGHKTAEDVWAIGV